MMNVFLIESEITDYPLNIFAKDSGHALCLYCIWRDHKLPDTPFVSAQVVLLTAADLVEQPQLAQAAAANISGVGYFVDHHQGWRIAPPDENVLLDIAPPDVSVFFFRFEEDDEPELLVFAPTLEKAIAFYTEWNLIAYGDRGEYTSVKETSRWLLTGKKATLRDDMDMGLVGVGAVCDDDFWRIIPADYEPTYGKR